LSVKTLLRPFNATISNSQCDSAEDLDVAESVDNSDEEEDNGIDEGEETDVEEDDD
jgi:hypothetical protein